MIAEDSIVGIWPDGSKRSVHFSLAAPFQAASGEWRCKLDVSPILSAREICGGNSMQSLCLAISLGLNMLEHFVETGGRLEYEDGTPYSPTVLGLRSVPSSDV
jgi:hypothetical protein